MENDFGLLEEFDIISEIQTPHLIHKDFSLVTKKRVAYSILRRKPEEILLMNSPAFSVDAILAGLSEKQIEHIALSAPDEYRKEIIDSLRQDYKIKEIMEIAQSMDEDLGENSTQNQERAKNVIQYIKDNRVVFEF
jgi:hypothetical protein